MKRNRVITKNTQPSMTRQSEKDSADINIMIEKQLRGQAINLAHGPGSYGDFSKVGDFIDNRNQIAEARSDFAALPSKIRRRYKDDVENLLAAFDDPDQANELREYGLLDPIEEPPPGPITPTPSGAPETPPATPPAEGD